MHLQALSKLTFPTVSIGLIKCPVASTIISLTPVN